MRTTKGPFKGRTCIGYCNKGADFQLVPKGEKREKEEKSRNTCKFALCRCMWGSLVDANPKHPGTKI